MTTSRTMFKPGQKVKDAYGRMLTVLMQDGCQVFVVELCNQWFHPSNLCPVNS